VKAADSPAATDTVRLVLIEPEPLAAVRITLLGPAVIKVCLGFFSVEVDPSPKLHDHDVGVPVDVSVNCTDCPAAGVAGRYLNEALSSASPTVTIWLMWSSPFASITVKVTVRVSAVA
jgi:hypothetical protein